MCKVKTMSEFSPCHSLVRHTHEAHVSVDLVLVLAATRPVVARQGRLLPAGLLAEERASGGVLTTPVAASSTCTRGVF